ncbi:formate dehydrogenase subunit delta [Bradyrhizobium sp. HKCCYLS1011]|uniref:formate dehydrogenase subunit delta n=1 Tax=Bradyrhizobium sp. HKCCYLS1011 TaxID=3420733 RepID=UPI003EBF216A
MSHDTHDRLIYMANQIGKFFHAQGRDKTAAGVAEHIKKFWDPRMRKSIFAHHDAGGAGLDPDVFEAIATLKQAAKEKA